tara:strand:- start:132 stop:356 length:225 start_codon:yes stop_codon:yes gene_type:complete
MEDPKSLEQLTELAEFIESYYGNDLETIIRQLHETIYMLHYIDKECFDQKEVQEKGFLLFHLAECLGKKSIDPT